MKVKATEMSSKLKVKIKELHRIVNEGEVFDVSPMRFEILSGKNKFKAVFVKKFDDEHEVINVKKEPKIVVEDEVNAEPVASEVQEDINRVEVEEPKPKKRGRKPKTVVENVEENE